MRIPLRRSRIPAFRSFEFSVGTTGFVEIKLPFAIERDFAGVWGMREKLDLTAILQPVNFVVVGIGEVYFSIGCDGHRLESSSGSHVDLPQTAFVNLADTTGVVTAIGNE